MDLLKHLFQQSKSKNLYGLRYETLDWEFVPEQSDKFKHFWDDKNSPATISFYYFNKEPNILSIKDENLLRYSYRREFNQSVIGIIKVELDKLQGFDIIETIFKSRQEPHGTTYIGSITVPFKDRSYVVKVQCPEIGITGIRESVIFDKICQEQGEKVDKDKINEIVKNFFRDPYDENIRNGFLMNLSELQEYDEMFPDHPLTIVRTQIGDLRLMIKIDAKYDRFEK
jgi:hypothetical protein